MPEICAGCKQEITKPYTYRSADGKIWHMNCWDKACSDFYYENVLDNEREIEEDV